MESGTFFELPREVSVLGQGSAEPDKGSNHVKAHLNGPRTPEDVCCHEGAMLGICVRVVARIAMSLRTGHNL